METFRPDVAAEMLRLSLLCRKADRVIAQSVGLSVDEMHCLNLLSSETPTSVKNLIDLVGVSSTRISKILRSLEQHGFVTRTMLESDRRMEQISLTAKGIEVTRKCLALSSEIGSQIIGSTTSLSQSRYTYSEKDGN